MKVRYSHMLESLFEFSTEGEVINWQAINDGVMGGISTSSITWNPVGTATFRGEVKLENNGGFASIRCLVPGLGTGHQGVALRVKGAGKFKFKLRTDPFVDGVTYVQPFLINGLDWQVVLLPFDDFKPFFRGLRLTDARLLDLASVQQIGILIGDHQPGPFALEIDWIRCY
ncbi:MAG: CIA30 family protein [Cyclobacteriaceae bacterium]|nr:CIA30 family protein [Cyclobacteriaceae bacterium]